MYDWNGLSGGTLPGRNAEGNEAWGLVQAVIRPHDEAFTNGTLRYPSLRALSQGGFCSLGSFSLSLMATFLEENRLMATNMLLLLL